MSLAKIERQMAAIGQGCLGKAADDEPVFVLRAKDKFAPQVVEFWATLVSGAVANIVPGTERSNETRAKVKEAKALAHQMRAWQEINGCKRPD